MAIQQGRWSVYAGSYVHWSYVGHSTLGTKERYAPYTAQHLIPSYPPYICWGHPSSAVYGSCVHYHTLADYIGRPKATRAVGTAVGDNPLAPFVPCHRVLPTSNTLGGYYWGHALKALLLLSELRPA